MSSDSSIRITTVARTTVSRYHEFVGDPRRVAQRSRSEARAAKELRRRYALQLVARAKDIRQRFFAISVERKIKHPAVAAICEVARKRIFA